MKDLIKNKGIINIIIINKNKINKRGRKKVWILVHMYQPTEFNKYVKYVV
jgi:hypothetical protein